VIPTGVTYKTIIFFSLRFSTFLSRYSVSSNLARSKELTVQKDAVQWLLTVQKDAAQWLSGGGLLRV
jgi:hypothetical protein